MIASHLKCLADGVRQAATHDTLRAQPGAFDVALAAADAARRGALPFQMNTTVKTSPSPPTSFE